MPPARLLFLTSGRRLPSSRFRIHPFVPRLRADGYACAVLPCLPHADASLERLLGRRLARGLGLEPLLTGVKLASRLGALAAAPLADLVVVERELLPSFSPGLELLATRLARAVHVDLDDAIHLYYERTHPALAPLVDRLQPEGAAANPIARALAAAAGVSAGNAGLAAFAREHNPRTRVVETAIDVARFRPGGRPDVPLVWTGSRGTLPYLEALGPALRRVPGARLLVICDAPPPELGVPVRHVRWSPRVEAAAVRRGAVGVMPLPDTPWTRGKCGLKLLQYMASGVACVASPVGVNPELLEGGACGLLAADTEAWVEALTRLLGDPALRLRLAVRARARVEARYSLEAVYPRLRAALAASRGAAE